MERPRLGCVEYLNTAPLVAGLEKCRDVELVFDVPARLGPGLTRGDFDLALVSLIDAACSEKPLTLLPCGIIGSEAQTLTVALFSAKPLDSVSRLLADTHSHTSVALARVVLHERHGVRPVVEPLEAKEGWWEQAGPDAACLLIGDKVVLNAPPPGRFPHRLDLGAAWRELTGLPFVYASWMCRAGREDEPSIRSACALLERQRRHNAARLSSLASREAAARGWPADVAASYLGSLLSFEPTPRHRLGAQAFIDRCAALGLAPASTLRWAGGAGV